MTVARSLPSAIPWPLVLSRDKPAARYQNVANGTLLRHVATLFRHNAMSFRCGATLSRYSAMIAHHCATSERHGETKSRHSKRRSGNLLPPAAHRPSPRVGESDPRVGEFSGSPCSGVRGGCRGVAESSPCRGGFTAPNFSLAAPFPPCVLTVGQINPTQLTEKPYDAA
jgi:hypothetical protein